jgi:endonuclease/exonuclease/phosphatase family metal-dependent hydrolase
MPGSQKPPLGRFNRFMLWLNYFAAIALLLSLVAAYISPRTFWPIAFFGISFPVLFILNLAFAIYWGMQMRAWALLSGIMLIASINNLLGNLQFHVSGKAPVQADIKVLNYNCMLFDLYNWSKNRQSRRLIFDMLQEEAPDILCLQEFYTSEQKGDYNNADTLKKFLRAKNMHAEYTITLRGYDHWGVATFTRFPIVRKGKIMFNTTSNNICIYTDMLIAGDTIRVYNIHLASLNFGKKEYKFIGNLGSPDSNTDINQSKNIIRRLKKGFIERAAQTEMIAAHMAACPYKIILCGDFNDTPSSFAYHTLSAGMSDAFRESGSGIGKTYHGALPFLRIDYILHDKSFTSFNYRRYPESLTDHYPVSCYLRSR